MSPQLPSDAGRDGFGDPRPGATPEPLPTHDRLAHDGELAEELMMAALVVVGICVLLLAGIVVAYCSGKPAVCRELLPGGWLALR